jgi:DNA-binding GntR family transcriptional regulator
MSAMSSQPAYRTIAAELRDQIRNGELRVGQRIPSTSELMERFGVSLTVARAAVAELKAAGLVRGQSGKGVFVEAVPATTETDTPARLDALERQVGQLSRAVESIRAQLNSGHST